ncbi:MAG: response regulator [Bacteroidales bacterium]|nr:response regulator [Bacteroidales bacterium]
MANNYTVRNLGVKEGLLHPDVRSIQTDGIGYLWIGTKAGLQRYDGNSFKTYLVDNPGEYARNPNMIRCMRARGKYLYMGTRTGIQCFNMHTESYVKNNKIRQAVLHNMEINKNGTLWFGAARDLFCFKHDTVTDSIVQIPIPVIKSLIKKRGYWINSIKTHNNKLFLGTNKGVLVFRKNELDVWKLCKADFIINDYNLDTKKTPRIKDLFVNDSIIIACTPSHVHVFSYVMSKDGIKSQLINKTWILGFFPEEMMELNSGNLSKDFYLDHENSLWVSSYNGLFRIKNIFNNNPTGQVYLSDFNKNSITSSNTGYITTDYRNNLLVAIENSGIDIINFNPKPIGRIVYNPYDLQNSLSHQEVISIDIDKDNNIWAGLQNGDVNVFNSNHEKIANIYSNRFNRQTFHKRYLNCVKSAGDTVIVSHRFGIDIINRNTFKINKVIKKNPILNFRVIESIEMDKNRNLWIGTPRTGLFKITPPYENTNFKLFDCDTTKPIHLTSLAITSVYYDKTFNELFVCTDVGLNQLILNENGEVQQINKITPVDFNLKQENFIQNITKINDTAYYLSSNHAILHKLIIERSGNTPKLKQLECFDLQDCNIGFIETMISDRKNNLWTNGNKIFKISQGNNINCQHVEPFENFVANSVAINSEGKLYFAGNNGIIHLNTNKLNTDTLKPVSKITGIYLIKPLENNLSSINSNKHSLIESKKYQHYQNDFRFEFSALHYINPEICTYAYILEGFDKTVQRITGSKAHVEYIDLPPGKYKFVVQSEINAGEISGYPDSYEFTIKPPWWFSAMAIISYCILITIIIYIGYVYTTKWIDMKKKLLVKDQVHQAKLRFFTNISHELRTPLTLILDPLDNIIQNDYSQTLINKYLPVVRKNANSLLELVNEIMEFRKVETGNLKIWAEQTNMNLFLEEIMEPFKQKAENQNITLELNTSEDSCMAWIDKAKFKRIINNLLTNAFKFTNSNINIYISPKKINFKEKLANSCKISNGTKIKEFVEIAVEDDGIGLNQNVLSNIFDRYYQEGSLNKLGTGIGLAYTKQLVLLHKGELLAESEKNKGTRFIIRLRKDNSEIPVDQLNISKEIKENRTLDVSVNNKTTINKIEVENRKPSNKDTILIVEDNEDIRNYLHDNLISNFNIILTANGREGVDQAMQAMPDIIVTDIMMPVMDGIELCKIVKTTMLTSHIPVIMLTAKTSVEHTIEGLEIGADTYIPKPFNLNILKAHVANLLSNRKLLRDKFKNGETPDPLKLKINITDKTFFEKIVSIISDNIMEPSFNVETLSNKIGMSRRNLQLKLKSTTGMTPLEFIRNVKLDHAAKMLQETDYNINEIADRTGFSSTEHFRKSFKEKFGVPPSKYLSKT